MEFNLVCVVFCLAIPCILWKEAGAVQCYDCKGCNDPFKESQATVTTCPYACMKVKAASDSVQYVTRGCWPTAENDCAKENYQGVEANVCACTTDKCNGADSHLVQKSIFVVMSAFLLTLGKIFFKSAWIF